jgi:L-lactate dehydrogenase (cytochrome)
MNTKALLNLQDFERAAARVLPSTLFGFVQGGAEDGLSVAANRRAFSQVEFIPRVLCDTAARSSAVSLWGETWSAPFGIAPMGAAAAMALDGDRAMARAAALENVPFVLSGSSLTPMEQVIRENPRAWFQLYPSADPEQSAAVVARAQACGFGTLVVTVDVPVGGRREDDIRNGYGSPLRPSWQLAASFGRRPLWLARTLLPTLRRHGMPHFENYGGSRAPMISRTATRSHRRDNLCWADLQRLRDGWRGKLVVKGVLAQEDARQALREVGADAVLVSNHGGRQLDGTAAPLAALPGMLAALPGATLFCDGGIRRGSDVLKAVGLGASLAWVGRPMMYAAVLGGTAGVRHAIGLLREEMLRTMALLGICQVAEAATRVRHPFTRSVAAQPSD